MVKSSYTKAAAPVIALSPLPEAGHFAHPPIHLPPRIHLFILLSLRASFLSSSSFLAMLGLVCCCRRFSLPTSRFTFQNSLVE